MSPASGCSSTTPAPSCRCSTRRPARCCTAELFVAALGASSYTYAEATWTQTLPDWIGSHTRAFAFLGGVPAMIGVRQPQARASPRPASTSRRVNRSYAEMAAHYDTAILPARPAKPRDKAKVEAAVLLATRWIIAKLRNRQFFSLAELNEAIRACVADLNNRPLAASRRQPARACSRSSSARRSSRCRPSPTSSPSGSNAGSGSTITSRSRGTTTRCRTRCCARRCGRGSRRARSRCSIAASASPPTCARPRDRRHTTVREHMPSSHRRYADWTPERLEAPGGRDRPQHLGAGRHHPARAHAPRAGLPRLRRHPAASPGPTATERLEAACARACRSARAPTRRSNPS